MFKNTQDPPEESLILQRFLAQKPNQLQKTFRSISFLASSVLSYIKKPLNYISNQNLVKTQTSVPTVNNYQVENKKSRKQMKQQKKARKRIVKYQQEDSAADSIDIEQDFPNTKNCQKNSNVELSFSSDSIKQLKKKKAKTLCKTLIVKKNSQLPRKRIKPNAEFENQNKWNEFTKKVLSEYKQEEERKEFSPKKSGYQQQKESETNNQLTLRQFRKKKLIPRRFSYKKDDNIKFLEEKALKFDVEKAKLFLQTQQKKRQSQQSSIIKNNLSTPFFNQNEPIGRNIEKNTETQKEKNSQSISFPAFNPHSSASFQSSIFSNSKESEKKPIFGLLNNDTSAFFKKVDQPIEQPKEQKKPEVSSMFFQAKAEQKKSQKEEATVKPSFSIFGNIKPVQIVKQNQEKPVEKSQQNKLLQQQQKKQQGLQNKVNDPKKQEQKKQNNKPQHIQPIQNPFLSKSPGKTLKLNDVLDKSPFTFSFGDQNKNVKSTNSQLFATPSKNIFGTITNNIGANHPNKSGNNQQGNKNEVENSMQVEEEDQPMKKPLKPSNLMNNSMGSSFFASPGVNPILQQNSNNLSSNPLSSNPSNSHPISSNPSQGLAQYNPGIFSSSFSSNQFSDARSMFQNQTPNSSLFDAPKSRESSSTSRRKKDKAQRVYIS